MFEWYMKRINQFIHVARYCRHPIIEAHLVLTRSAINNFLGSGEPDPKTVLDHVIRLSAEQAGRDGFDDAAAQLLSVAEKLSTQDRKSAEVVAMRFPGFGRSSA